jgi:putative transposase
VTQRGARRQDVFLQEGDEERYLEFVAEAADAFGVTIRAWCLMPNHVHFVAEPGTEDALAKCFGSAHNRYSRMINFREGWRGFIFQGRFASSPMDGPHLYHALRYVLRNPVRAGLVRVPWRCEWSSAAFHTGKKRDDPLAKRSDEIEEMAGNWTEYLVEPDDDDILCRLRRETHSGRPLGAEEFVVKLERKLKRKLTRQPPGRPKKKGRRNR